MSAYACEPGKGSEPGVGWNWVQQMARFHELWVMTRANNQATIESDASASREGIHWVYYDLPRWTRFWKRGSIGIQTYYLLWQRGVSRVARKLHSHTRFHLAHHVTFGKFWVPSPLARLPIPLIMGPVGGGESTPAGFGSTYSLPGKLSERARDVGRRFACTNPAWRSLLRRTHTLIAATPETARWLSPLASTPVQLEPQCGMTDAELRDFGSIPIRTKGPFRLLSVARLTHWKGIHLGLRAFAKFAEASPLSEYWIVSSGPEERRLKWLANELRIAHKVTFWGRLPSLSDVYEKLAAADVFVHPALHEAFGYACLEALAAGRPVLCLDCGGPALQVTPACGIAVAPRSPGQAVEDLAAAMRTLNDSPSLRIAMAEEARRRVRDHFHWDKKGEKMNRLYLELARSYNGNSFLGS